MTTTKQKSIRKKIQCHIWLEQQDKDNLVALAESYRLSMSNVIRYLIDKELGKNDCKQFLRNTLHGNDKI